MSRILQPGGAEFADLFRSFTYTAYRLETLQVYAVDYEHDPVRAFLAGEPQPDSPVMREWRQLLRDTRAAGKRMHRVHVVVEPLTDYLRYEIACAYDGNVAAGEEIRILPVREGEWPVDVPHLDYWLFDSSRLYEMHYADDGTWLAVEEIGDPTRVVAANHARDAAWQQATDYRNYVSGQVLRTAS